MSHVDPHYARTDDYRQQLEEIQKSGVCPFCPQHFNWHPHPIVHETAYWRVTPIREPYPNARLHWLAILNHHKTTLTELSIDEWQNLLVLLDRMCREFDISGGGIAMRFGPSELTGSSVAHLHMHLIVPAVDPSTTRARVVNFPFG